MDMQEYIKATIQKSRQAKLEETHQMTLGELIDKLEAIPLTYGANEEPKSVVYSFEFLRPTTLDSWRGAYSELALGWNYGGYAPDDCPDHNSKYKITLEELLKETKSAVGKTFIGWKGGDYIMSKDTPIWIANPGNTGSTGIVEVVDNGYEVILMTGYYEY